MMSKQRSEQGLNLKAERIDHFRTTVPSSSISHSNHSYQSPEEHVCVCVYIYIYILDCQFLICDHEAKFLNIIICFSTSVNLSQGICNCQTHKHPNPFISIFHIFTASIILPLFRNERNDGLRLHNKVQVDMLTARVFISFFPQAEFYHFTSNYSFQFK